MAHPKNACEEVPAVQQPSLLAAYAVGFVVLQRPSMLRFNVTDFAEIVVEPVGELIAVTFLEQTALGVGPTITSTSVVVAVQGEQAGRDINQGEDELMEEKKSELNIFVSTQCLVSH